MDTTNFSNILLDKSPKKINDVTEKILDTLFNINEVVREINSIDFCNPLGYILTKALPPEGKVDNLLKEYGKKSSAFINKVTNKFELNSSNADSISNDIEEIRLSLEDLILPEELKDIIPGADGLTKLVQDLNDSLVLTNTLISIADKKVLIKSFSNRLLPLSNPINLTEALLFNQSKKLNQQLTSIIKPERFRADLIRLIKLVTTIDKLIKQIQNIVTIINKIIKTINTLIKILGISIKILKLAPIPAKFVTVGLTTTASSKVSQIEGDIKDLSKILKATSVFLDKSVIRQIQRIRNEIFILLIGLNQLLENLSACSYFTNDNILGHIRNSISTLNNNLILIDTLFPSIQVNNQNNSNLYNGYNIIILKETTTDNNTSLFRKYVIVTNSQNIVEYEGTPTYATDDQILIKEGQYYIDLKQETSTSDNGNDNITDDDAFILMRQIGYQTNSLEESTYTHNKIKQQLNNQIQNNPEDKKIYDSLNESINPSPQKIDQIKRIIKQLVSYYNNNPNNIPLLQTRLKLLSTSLSSKGFTSEEIEAAFKSSHLERFEIKIINNNITIIKN